jgi:hypothetical protein
MDLHRAAAMSGCFGPEPDRRPRVTVCGHGRCGLMTGVAGDVQGRS